MGKWIMGGLLLLLTPWILSLVCMRAAGQAVLPLERERVEQEEQGEEGTQAQEGHGADGEQTDAAQVSASISRRILVERGGVGTYMDLEDYLPGVIVCQIDTGYHLEALKCQAVIARTYISRVMEGRTEIHEGELDLDYLEAESGVLKGGEMSLQERERLADGLARCRTAVQETRGLVIKYDDRPILPLFHGISAGRTRTGESEYPYLQAAESQWDTQRELCFREFTWSFSEFAELINGIPGAQPVSPEQIPGEIQTVKKDDSGYTMQIKVGAKTYTGEEVQYALKLPSACFSLDGKEGSLQANVKGVGHGYGLSQAGADHMASSGWSFEEILQYYYKNISLVTE